jgi:hypothetical protein
MYVNSPDQSLIGAVCDCRRVEIQPWWSGNESNVLHLMYFSSPIVDFAYGAILD